MRVLILSYVLLVTVTVCLAKSTSSASIFLTSTTATCKSHGLECADCETLQYCSVNMEPLFSVKCAEQSKLRPFCDQSTNACVATEPKDCKAEATKFICPGTGTYPDLVDCRKYYTCPADGSDQEHVNCASTQIYSHAVKGCARGICRTYNSKLGLCKGKINKLIAYADKNLYVLCLADAPKLLQCPKNEIFDEVSVSCKFQCTQDGFYPAREADKFYFCYKVGKAYQEMLLECPTGFEFASTEEGKGACVPKEIPTTTTKPNAETEVPITSTTAPTETETTEGAESTATTTTAPEGTTTKQTEITEDAESEVTSTTSPEEATTTENQTTENVSAGTEENLNNGADDSINPPSLSVHTIKNEAENSDISKEEASVNEITLEEEISFEENTSLEEDIALQAGIIDSIEN